MYKGSELKQYIDSRIKSAHDELMQDSLGSKPLTQEEKDGLKIELEVLEDVKHICESRGRF